MRKSQSTRVQKHKIRTGVEEPVRAECCVCWFLGRFFLSVLAMLWSLDHGQLAGCLLELPGLNS